MATEKGMWYADIRLSLSFINTLNDKIFPLKNKHAFIIASSSDKAIYVANIHAQRSKWCISKILDKCNTGY